MLELRDWLGKPRPVSLAKLKKKDGAVCTTAEEAAEARKCHFEALVEKKQVFDGKVMDYEPFNWWVAPVERLSNCQGNFTNQTYWLKKLYTFNI